MSADDGELAVDVLIIGGGIMGHYLARQLVDDYSICLLTDPTVRVETLEAEGYFSAGYDGNDVSRIQPARRAASYWQLWCESNGVAHNGGARIWPVSGDDDLTRTRLWSDAALVFRRLDDLPPVLGGGSLADHTPYSLESDLVVDTADVLTELRSGLEDKCLSAEVMRFAVAGDAAIAYVDVDIDGEIVPISARYVVLAASAGNAGLLNKVAVRLRDPATRKEKVEASKVCQAVRHRHLLCVSGAGLPVVSGHFGDLQVAAHPLAGGGSTWVINPPIDDTRTTLGAEDLRFDPLVDSAVVRSAVASLFAASPEVSAKAGDLSWSVYARRKTEHPMMAVDDTSNVAQPAPAKIETFGLDGFMALWPSHLSYAMVVGDVAAERIRESLGPRGDYSDELAVSELAKPAEPMVSRWARDDFPWSDWNTFAAAHDIG